MRTLLVGLLVAAAGSAAAQAPEFVEATYQPSDRPLANPERGLYVELDDRRREPLDIERLNELRSRDITLVQRLYYLKGYRDRPLDDAQLNLVRDDFAAVRTAGMKAIVRFAYSSRIGEPDAPLPVVLGHIEQLGPLLRENSDLCLTVQAGFIGAWGEWHASTNGLTEPDAMRRVVEALLDALPEGLTIQVRTPKHKQLLLGHHEPLRAAPTERASLAARIGHHNDCFLADETDVGTYRESRLEADRGYVAADSAYVPVGGETCGIGPRIEPALAREELARMHWSFLNLAYHRGVISRWRDTGFLQEVQDHLGYRLRLASARFAAQVDAGDHLQGEIVVVNDGWAAPINPRTVELVFVGANDGTTFRAPLTADVRDWRPGKHKIVINTPLPKSASPGDYEVFLSLNDSSPRLREDPRYSIRLANAGPQENITAGFPLGLVIRVITGSGETSP